MIDLEPSALLREPARLSAIRRLALENADARAAFDRIARIATELLRVPVALVSIVEEDRQVFHGCVGLPEPWMSRRETPLSHSFCQHVVASGEAFLVEDARVHPLVADNLAIRDLDVVAYAGIPLVTDDGHVLGSFCAIDSEPRRWTTGEVASLRDLTASVMTEINLRSSVAAHEEAQSALWESQRFLQSSLDALTAHIAIVDENGVILAVNAAWRRFAEQNEFASPAYGIGANYIEACSVAEMCGDAAAGEVALGIRAVLDGDLPAYEYEYPCHSPDEQRWFVVRVTRFADTDPPRAVIAHENVTLRRLAERETHTAAERVRLAIERSPVIVFNQDRELRYTWIANPAPGLTPELVIGKSDDELFSERDAATLRAIKAPVLDGGIGARQRLRVTVAGTERAYDLSIEPWRDASGEIVGITGAALDVTDQEIEETERRAFLDTIAHDLRNPLGVVKSQAQLLQRRLRRDPSGANLEGGLAMIDNAVGRMTTIIDELLDVAYTRAGNPLKLDRRTTDLIALVRAAVRSYQTADERHEFRVQIEPSELVGQWDAARLDRVLGNLLSNAIKYSPDGGVIVVRVREEMRDLTRWAVVAVEDQGVGIPARDLPHIFSRFRRGGNVEGRIAGTGIGLAGAKQIVDQHGGTIEVESTEGSGSTFTIFLPLPPDREVSLPALAS